MIESSVSASSGDSLMRLPEIQIDSRIFAGLANNPLLDAAGFDASVIFCSRMEGSLQEGSVPA